MNEKTITAAAIINALEAVVENTVIELQSDIEPDVPDDHTDAGDDYEPSMHNQHPAGGKRYPELDGRWVAIGYTDLQKGILALKKAAGVV